MDVQIITVYELKHLLIYRITHQDAKTKLLFNKYLGIFFIGPHFRAIFSKIISNALWEELYIWIGMMCRNFAHS